MIFHTTLQHFLEGNLLQPNICRYFVKNHAHRGYPNRYGRWHEFGEQGLSSSRVGGVHEDNLIATIPYCELRSCNPRGNRASPCSHGRLTSAYLVCSGRESRRLRATPEVFHRSLYAGNIPLRVKNQPVEFSTSGDFIYSQKNVNSIAAVTEEVDVHTTANRSSQTKEQYLCFVTR